MSEAQLLTWCVVANVVEGGTKHFSAGTKVWVLPPQWGDGGEDLFVVGRHRGRAGGVVRMVLPRRHLEGFRVRPVYSPDVLVHLERAWQDGQERARMWATRDEAEVVAAAWAATS